MSIGSFAKRDIAKNSLLNIGNDIIEANLKHIHQSFHKSLSERSRATYFSMCDNATDVA